MTESARIAKNAALLMVASTGQKVLSFVTFLFVARLIGREATGVFFYSVSITSIFVIVADLGMTPVIIRAMAGDIKKGERYLSAALRLKMWLIPVAILCALGYAWIFHADRTTFLTVAIACLVMSADTIHLALYGVLRGRQDLRPEAIGMFIGQILTAIVSVFAAALNVGPIGLACGLLAGSSWNVAWSIFQIRRRDIHLEVPQLQDIRQFALESLPFAIAGISVKVYSFVDSLFLRQFHGASAVGAYAVPYKLTYALQFLPMTFTAALYPALSSSFASRRSEHLYKVFSGSMRLMGAISFPLSAGLSALAARLIPLLYGDEFEPSIGVLKILPWVLIPIFLDFPIGSLMNATHKAGLKTIAMLLTMVMNVALNAILVPRYSIIGAAWAGVVSFWGLYLIGAWLTRETADRGILYVKITLQTLIASGVSWYAWGVIGARLPFIAAIVFGGAVAILMAFVTRLIVVEDVYAMFTRFRFVPQNIEEEIEA